MWPFECGIVRHKFRPRFSYSFPEKLELATLTDLIVKLGGQREANGMPLMAGEVGVVVKSFLNRNYIYDICEKCGEIRDERSENT
jgi:hypothetical protein